MDDCEKMCSVNGDDTVFDNGDRSELITPPPRKQRKVSAAVHNYPEDCAQKKEVVVCGVKKEKGRNVYEAEKMLSEEPERVDIPGVRSNGVEELLDMDVVNQKESQNGTEYELPHYPIPPNLVRKKWCFPPPRRVSAIRDFPDGCGPNGPMTGKRHRPVNKREDDRTNLGRGRSSLVSRQVVCREEGDEDDSLLPAAGVGSLGEKGARRKVKETLCLFNNLVRKLAKKSGRVDGGIQPYLKEARKMLKDRGKCINTIKMPGPVPGVEVGDFFNYRAELTVIGLHGPGQSGIDFVKRDNELIATSVVASGRYDNVVDKSDVLIYSGQGGNAVVGGGRKQVQDQKLQRGNLALKNSIHNKNLVRVIRGFKMKHPRRSNKVSTYVYDGLYTVKRYWSDHGDHGKLVYKFELRRVPNQPELSWKDEKQLKKFKSREGSCVIKDISKGKDVPIRAVNTIDDEKPSPFTYINAVIYPEWYHSHPKPHRGCDCKEGCSDSRPCCCLVKNGGEIPYNESGEIIDEKCLVYECGPSCKCPPSCQNRVSQHDIKLPLEIFKTQTRGWGVRCLSSITSGSFVCEYIGELLHDKEADQRTDIDEYLFDIGQNYSDPSIRAELAALMPDHMPSSCSDDVVENLGFTLDAAKYGNVGRFINHSCSPNMFAQNVLYDHEDKRIPHIMFFAAENIPPLKELTYHYNYKIDQVHDSEGNIRKKSCYCGSSECTGRMY